MEIRLFVCCHRPEKIPQHPLLVPIQVGAALSIEYFQNFLHDDESENISEKNRSYCELTAQYWAWKNMDVNWYGFFHYRRFLYPDADAKRPYRIAGVPTSKLLGRLGYDNFAALIERHDVIAPIGEDMCVSVREHYANAPYHHRKDLDLIEQIILERYPEMVSAMNTYLSGTVCYFGNIYIMKRQVFHAYCGWLFPVLEEFDRRADLSGYSPQELRVDGYLAERLFGIWLTYARDGLRVCEIPRVHFVPNRKERNKKKLMNLLLPPGSKRRAAAKMLKM